ncbi:tyrosine-type recombinase/integrase [Tranquillimonas alkanivorans]|uniref:Phage integrase family protein n=1 Tax=Tranquillimonas alkanivorans TaxID=441119 RepID=A0A1I5PBV7_9RHOB|nr:integrase arm-type DNA-binding domain-containing protein [Tranquillimonas alkanivorans]SFP31463.1 Phage integrase family protein [Tranquillimonas alkanivorans]
MSATKTRLTDAQVRAAVLPDGKTEAVLWDTDVSGFGLRLRGKSKTFILSYRPHGAGRAANAKRLKLGTPSTVDGVKEARRLARAALGKVAAGEDPVEERKQEKRRADATVAALLDRYDAHLERRQYVTRTDVLSLLRRRLAPLAARDLAEVKGWELAELIEKLDKEGRGSAASTFRTRCNTFLNWCAFEARVIDSNPLAGYRRRRDTRAERVAKRQRGRALSDAELAAVWRTAGDETSFGRLVRFLILTGCRRNEAAKLLWSMADRERARIDLPATFTKQARGHTVFIAGPLEDLFAACDLDARGSYVFPSPRTGGPMSGWSKIMDPHDHRTKGGTTPRTPGFVKACGVDFTLHDLRRTFRTGLSRLGVDREIAELALGHAREDLEARYNRDDCETALRQAFGAWAEHVRREVDERGSVFD